MPTTLEQPDTKRFEAPASSQPSPYDGPNAPTQPSPPADRSPAAAEAETTVAADAHVSGANWFFWIAGLSLVNSVVTLTGTDWGFIIGLGITQLVDFIGMQAAVESGFGASIAALAVSGAIAATFVVFGVLARKGFVAAFVIGGTLYAFDTLLFLIVGDFVGVAFHGLALVFLFMGMMALLASRKAPTPATAG